LHPFVPLKGLTIPKGILQAATHSVNAPNTLSTMREMAEYTLLMH